MEEENKEEITSETNTETEVVQTTEAEVKKPDFKAKADAFYGKLKDSQREVEELKARYKKGGLGDVVLKKRLVDVLESLLKPIRERRAEYAKDKTQVMQILKDGTEHARDVAAQTLSEVKKAMKLEYF